MSQTKSRPYTLPLSPCFIDYNANWLVIGHAKTQTSRVQKIIEERIGSLTEKVEIATNVKLNPLYIADRKDEIETLRWTTRIIRWVLDWAIDWAAAWSKPNTIGVGRH